MIKIFTDGSTKIKNKKGFSNKGGFGYVVYQDNIIIDAFSKQVENTTNNEMELTALITAIEKYGTSETWDCPIIYSDSMYAINCLTLWGQTWKNNQWKKSNNQTIENLELVKKGISLLDSGNYNVEIQYCKGHNGIEGNELADKLATREITVEEILYNKKGENNEKTNL